MKNYIFSFIVFLIGFYLIGLRLVGVDFDGIPGDMGDARLNNLFLEQGYLYISGQINSFWDASFFYPDKGTMSISDNLLGTMPLYALFRALSFDRETAFQIWFLSLLALNFFSCLICLHKLKMSLPAAAIGAYIFAFSLPVAGGIGHIQMSPKFAIPIIIFCLIRFMQHKKPIHLFLFFSFIVYQVYCGIYLGFMAIITSVMVFFVLAISAGFKKEMRLIMEFVKKHWVKVGLTLILSSVLLFILLKPYIFRFESKEGNYLGVPGGMPGILSYFHPADHSLLYGWLKPIGQFITNSHEHTLFMGMIFIVAISWSIYLIRTKKNNEIKIWFASFVLLFVFTLNIYHSVSLYAIICLFPGFHVIRAVSRIVQVELFFVGGMVAVLIDYWLRNYQKNSKRIVFIGLVFSLLVIDQFVYRAGLSSHSKKEAQQRVVLLKLKLQNIQSYDAFFYVDSNKFKGCEPHIDAMIVSQDLKIPTVNGYSAFSPPAHQRLFENPDSMHIVSFLKEAKIESKKLLVIKD